MTPFNHLPLTDDLADLGGDPCAGSTAAINSVTATEEQAPTCSGNDWLIGVDITMDTALGADEEFKIYVAEDSAGTSYSFWKRSTSVNHQYNHSQSGFFGSGGSGASTTEYAKFKVEVVGKDRDEVCNGPVESNQVSHTDPACTT